jgi:Na+-translocating ferredoxin:NAD+ oxidoreductase RnfG subunit
VFAQGAAPTPPKVAASVQRVFGKRATATAVAVDGDSAYRVTRGDTLLGFALVREVKGKDQPITFLVATDTADRLKDIDILVYREPYGGEVAYEAWRRQFRGKSASDPLQVGRDIRSISGATISVNAVTLGVRRALHDLTTWRRSGALS